MEQEVMSPEQIQETNEIAQRMAMRAGENTRTYSAIPTITVYNPSKTKEGNMFELGDLVKTIKTDQGYSSEKFENPFTGVILKVRMYLSLKYKYAEGKPRIITSEFDSYSDDQLIVVKQQDAEGVYSPVFIGNYKQVNDKYSLKDDTTIEKKLDLHHAIYVLKDGEIIRVDCKGLSRSNFFDYMKAFTRRDGDFMSAHQTIFGSEKSEKDYRGNVRQMPIAAFSFTKGDRLGILDLKKTEEIQIELTKQIEERDKMFGNIAEKPEKIVEPKEELPTIQLEEEKSVDIFEGLPVPENEEEEVKIEDVPF